MKHIAITILTALLTVSAYAQTRIKATNPNIEYIGRVSHKTPGCVKFSFPGVQIRAVFEGTSLSMIMKPGSGYYMVEVDNDAAVKVLSTKEDSLVTLATGLANGRHNVVITSCNEGHTLKPEFHGFILDSGCSLPCKPQLPQRKIEFIGNSITCALGIEDFSADHKNANNSTQNAYYSFAHQTARHLNAQAVLVARSGIGIYRNTGGKRDGDRNNMQACYDNVFYTFDANAEKWNFSRYVPDVVCINLGTNDTTNPAYDTTLLTAAFVKFVKRIRSNYPKAKIVLLTGTMRKGQRLADLKMSLANAVTQLNADGITDIYRFDFTPADGSLGYGSFMHPSLKQHTQMADDLTKFLREIMNWE